MSEPEDSVEAIMAKEKNISDRVETLIRATLEDVGDDWPSPLRKCGVVSMRLARKVIELEDRLS